MKKMAKYRMNDNISNTELNSLYKTIIESIIYLRDGDNIDINQFMKVLKIVDT